MALKNLAYEKQAEHFAVHTFLNGKNSLKVNDFTSIYTKRYR